MPRPKKLAPPASTHEQNIRTELLGQLLSGLMTQGDLKTMFRSRKKAAFVRGFFFLETAMNTPMTPTTRDGWVSMPLDEFERLIEDAAERGAKRAVTDVGLDGESAAADIPELRGLLEAFNTAKHTAWQTLIRMVTTGFILALVAGALIKLKLFGGGH